MSLLQMGLILILMCYLGGCIFLILGILTKILNFRFTDGKEHTPFQYIIGFIVIILLWPLCIRVTKKEDK